VGAKLRFSDGAPRPPASTTTPLMRRAPKSAPKHPSRVTTGTTRFSQTRQGAFLPTPPAPPHSVQSPRRKKGPTERAAERRNGRGPTNATTASSIVIIHTDVVILVQSGAYFLTAGFQATIRLTEAPPRIYGVRRVLDHNRVGLAGCGFGAKRREVSHRNLRGRLPTSV
jgi:hypothetical protein